MKKIGGKQGVVYYGQCENGEMLIIILLIINIKNLFGECTHLQFLLIPRDPLHVQSKCHIQ